MMVMTKLFPPKDITRAADEDDAVCKARLAAARADLEAMRRSLEAEEHDAALEAPGAADRVLNLQQRMAQQEATVGELERAASKASAQVARLAQARADALDEARRQSVPILREEVEASAIKIAGLAASLGAAIEEHADLSARLGDALGSGEAKRVLSKPALAYRLQLTLAKLLNSDTAASRKWLPWPLPTFAAEWRESFDGVTRKMLDDLVQSFATEEAAKAARDRLDPAGGSLHVVKDRWQVWTLVKGRLRGVAAQRAAVAKIEER